MDWLLSWPLRTLQITTPAGFEDYAAMVGEPAAERRLPDPGPVDPVVLAHAGRLHGVEILGPPPGSASCAEKNAGIQKRRRRSPMGVPGPVRVSSSFSCRGSISSF